MKFLRQYSLFFKLALCFVVVIALVRSNKLDFAKLSLFYQEPQAFVFYFFAWSLGILFLNGMRWRMLLSIFDVGLSKVRASSLTAIGLFFSTFLPGSISGDAVKGYYIILENKNLSKAHLFSTILVDRLIGLYGIFAIGTIAILSVFSFEEILEKSALIMPILVVFFLMTILSFFFFVSSVRLIEKVEGSMPKFFKGVFSLGKLYKNNFKILITSVLMTMFVQSAIFMYFVYLTSFYNDISLHWKSIFVIYPLGIISLVIPLFPGGLGVGHATFELLYQQFGLVEGANIFNLYFVGMLCLNLLGLVPYLLFKREDKVNSSLVEA